MIELIIAIMFTATVVYLSTRAAIQSKWGVLNQKPQHNEQVFAQSKLAYNTLALDKNNLLQQNTKLESQLRFMTEQYKTRRCYQKEKDQLFQERIVQVTGILI